MKGAYIMQTVDDKDYEMIQTFLKFWSNIVGALKKEDSTVLEQNHIRGKKALKNLDNHVRSGHLLEMDSIALKDASLYRDILKARNITFVESIVEDKQTHEKRIVFFTKDTDKHIVDKARERFKYELGQCVGEISYDKFLEMNDGNKELRTNNLTRAEVEVFKRNVAEEDYNLSYAISKEKDGTYSIHYLMEDKNGIDRALRRTAYDLSDSNGKELESKIEENLTQRDEFFKKLTPKDSETIFVVDRECPENFIAISKDKVFSYSVSREKQENAPDILKVNTRELSFQELKGTIIHELHNPTIVHQDDMAICKKIKNASIQIYPDPEIFKERYLSFSKAVLNNPDMYSPFKIEDSIQENKQIFALTNLNESSIDRIKRAIEKNELIETAIVDNTIAYTGKMAAKVEAIIEQEMFIGLTDEQKLCNKLEMQGHGHLDFKAEEPQYVFDSKKPNMVFEISKESITIYNFSKPKDDPMYRMGPFPNDENFRKITIENINNFVKSPVILTKDEMALPHEERINIIHEREGENLALTAKDLIYTNESQEKLDFVNKRETKNTVSKEAEHRRDTWIDKEYIVDKNILERIRHPFKEKIIKEKHKAPNQDVGQEL